ncbi:MAG: hypothetical protein RLZZ373_2201 [Pseudomonadota bacterium]|jgi:ATP-dependent DNA helicase RecG
MSNAEETQALLFDKNPRYFLPGAYVEFIRFPGTTMTERPTRR